MYNVEKFLPGFGWQKETSYETQLEAAWAIEDMEEEDEADGLFFNYRVSEEE